jgi:hypothetical protein
MTDGVENRRESDEPQRDGEISIQNRFHKQPSQAGAGEYRLGYNCSGKQESS